VDIASSQTRTIIFSTHIVNDLERVSSRLWLLKDGVLTLDEDIEALKDSRPQPLEDIFLEVYQ
jgi:ABC-type multidrug transport system ATPase subunit